MLSFLILPLAALAFSFPGLFVVGEKERLAVMRLGRFVGVRGPGVVWVIPYLDTATRIDLDREIPYWQSLPTEQLNAEIERHVTGKGPSA